MTFAEAQDGAEEGAEGAADGGPHHAAAGHLRASVYLDEAHQRQGHGNAEVGERGSQGADDRQRGALGIMTRSSQGLKRPDLPGLRGSISRPAPTSVKPSRRHAANSRVPMCTALIPIALVEKIRKNIDCRMNVKSFPKSPHLQPSLSRQPNGRVCARAGAGVAGALIAFSVLTLQSRRVSSLSRAEGSAAAGWAPLPSESGDAEPDGSGALILDVHRTGTNPVATTCSRAGPGTRQHSGHGTRSRAVGSWDASPQVRGVSRQGHELCGRGLCAAPRHPQGVRKGIWARSEVAPAPAGSARQSAWATPAR